jgi:hypothetical protein
MTSDYKIPLKCSKTKKTSWFGAVFKSPAGYHMMYYGILFAGAINLMTFINSIDQSTTEINRLNGKDTACKLCFYDGTYYKVSYFNLVHFRQQNNLFFEDVHVTKENFAIIKSKSKTGVDGTEYDGVNPAFNTIESSMPSDTPPVVDLSPTPVIEPVAQSAPEPISVSSPNISTLPATTSDATPVAVDARPVTVDATMTAPDATPVMVDAAMAAPDATPVTVDATMAAPDALVDATPVTVDATTPTSENQYKQSGGDIFPPKDVVEPFLLKEKMKNKQILPIPDPGEPSQAEIQSMANAEKQAPKGGKRTKRRKPKSRKIKLYL